MSIEFSPVVHGSKGGKPTRTHMGNVEVVNQTPYAKVADYVVRLNGLSVGFIRDHNRKDGGWVLLARVCRLLANGGEEPRL